MSPPRSVPVVLCWLTLLLGVTKEVRADDRWKPETIAPAGFVSLDGLPPEPISPDSSTFYYENGVQVELPSLEEELLLHGGAQMYEPSDVNNRIFQYADSHADTALRLPECVDEPQPPITSPIDYLGPGLIQWHPDLSWFGCDPHMWEPRFVLHGAYEVFGTVYEQNNDRRDGIGHQLFVDIDLQLTGTERFHIQFRPLGEENTGGSFWQLNDPQHYFDNSTGVPQRWWFEGELQSIFGPWRNDERHQLDINFTIGRFPFRLHNGLLMNDEVIGVVIGKNTITSLPFSNLNVQTFYALDQVDSFPNTGELVGTHLSADYRHIFFEATYAYLNRDRTTPFSTHYLAGSGTKFFGPLTFAFRSMYRVGDTSRIGNGHLQVVEASLTRLPPHDFEALTGIELAVAYLNLFYASDNWTTIAGGNFDRLRNSFEVNPLLNLAAGAPPAQRQGAALGVQLFRHHKDESFIPEVAYEEQSSDSSVGFGLRYRRKMSQRSFLELRGIKTWSDAAILRREGLFASTTVIF